MPTSLAGKTSKPAAGGALPARSPSSGVTLLELTVVMAIIGLLSAISYPAISAGLDSVRLASTSGSIASFLNGAVNRAERLQQPVEVDIFITENRLTMTSAVSGFNRELRLPDGISLEAVLTGNPQDSQEDQDGPRRLILMPGSTVPGIGIQFANRHGARRIVRLDPMTGFPRVESVETK